MAILSGETRAQGLRTSQRKSVKDNGRNHARSTSRPEYSREEVKVSQRDAISLIGLNEASRAARKCLSVLNSVAFP
jgi:hypothetical protein